MNNEQGSFRFDKEQSPAPEVIDLSGETLERAHFLLGQMNRSQIQYQFKERLKRTKKTALERDFDLMRKVRERGLELSQQLKANPDEKHLLLGTAIELYFSCLDQWSAGAKIDPLYSLWLQNDNANCVTVMHREKDGSIVIGHTEEDTVYGYRNDPQYKPTIAVLTSPYDQSKQIKTSIIPTLLPGPAFAYTDGYFQSVNGLYQDQNPEGRALANMAVWLTMVLANQVDPLLIVKKLAPYLDGYSLNVVQNKNGRVEASLIRFIHGAVEIVQLGDESGAVIVCNNVVDKQTPMVLSCQRLPADRLETLESRYAARCSLLPGILERLNRLAEEKRGDINPMAILLSLEAPKLLIRNPAITTATVVCRISPNGGETQVAVGAGPASKRGYEFTEKIR